MKTLMNISLAMLLSMMTFSASAVELPLMGDRLIEAEAGFSQAMAVPCDDDDLEDKVDAKSDPLDEESPIEHFMGWEDEGRP